VDSGKWGIVIFGSPQICGKRQLKLHQRKAQNRPTPIGIEPAQAGFVGFVAAISIAHPHKSGESLIFANSLMFLM
jgi:hypothetical protein